MSIVGKWAHGRYQTEGRGTSWLKIQKSDYSQMVGRHEIFEARRGRGPSVRAPELRLA
jgi:hypothetical protein